MEETVTSTDNFNKMVTELWNKLGSTCYFTKTLTVNRFRETWRNTVWLWNKLHCMESLWRSCETNWGSWRIWTKHCPWTHLLTQFYTDKKGRNLDNSCEAIWALCWTVDCQLIQLGKKDVWNDVTWLAHTVECRHYLTMTWLQSARRQWVLRCETSAPTFLDIF